MTIEDEKGCFCGHQKSARSRASGQKCSASILYGATKQNAIPSASIILDMPKSPAKPSPYNILTTLILVRTPKSPATLAGLPRLI